MVSSKKVLIVSPVQNPAALNPMLEKLEEDFSRVLYNRLDSLNVPVLHPSTDINLSESSELNNYFAIHKPFLVVIVLPFGKDLKKLFLDSERKTETLEMIRQVVDVSQRSESSVILLSDYHVFGAETKSAYSESDTVSPMDDFGRFIVEMESIVAGALENHLILRFGWVIGGATSNLFADILHCLISGGEKTVSRYRRGSPTWQEDSLRVLVGVIRQVLAGASNWGVFHYCSSDNCNEWEFGQEVLSTLHAIQDSKDQKTVGTLITPPDKHSDKELDSSPLLEPASSTLSCRRIRNNFGIQPRSWRQGLKANIQLQLEKDVQVS